MPFPTYVSDRILDDWLRPPLCATLGYCPVLVTAPEHRPAAIVGFTFNIRAGRLQASTLRRRINRQDWSKNAALERCG
ncbi:glycoside hydrolase family protein [Nitrosomonas mobilis]|uniref:glycoside hydrolase family protein n=1 Tax=Nitrosomonas mobilis TaxID=51642 RepID=UPI001C409CDF|nr:hypothetical protein [Nitrosomonas mobilis]